MLTITCTVRHNLFNHNNNYIVVRPRAALLQIYYTQLEMLSLEVAPTTLAIVKLTVNFWVAVILI